MNFSLITKQQDNSTFESRDIGYIKNRKSSFYLINVQLDSFISTQFQLQLHNIKSKNYCMCNLPNNNFFVVSSSPYHYPLWASQRQSEGRITFIIEENKKVKILKSGIPFFRASLAYHDGCIYVFAGYNFQYAVSCAERFIIKKNKWEKLPNVPGDIWYTLCF